MEVARRVGGEIVSVDSMQVYRGMDIGTCKPSPAERAEIPHHMLDLVEPSEEFSVAWFQSEARSVIETAEAPLLLVGGSGLHLRAVIDPLEFPPTDPGLRAELESRPLDDLIGELSEADPAVAARVDLANPRRVVRAIEILRLTGATPSMRADSAGRRLVDDYQTLLPVTMVGLDPGEELKDRIRDRVEQMWRDGLVAEVEGLRGRLGRTASGAVGYRQILDRGDEDEAACQTAVVSATIGLARRQRTFFRRDPRIEWLDPAERLGTLTDRIVEEWRP